MEDHAQRYDTGDETQVKRRKTRSQLLQEEKEAAIRAVMNTPAGRWILNDLWAEGRVFSDSFNPDPYWHAFNAGKQSSAKKSYSEVHTICPELQILAEREAQEREKKYA